MKSPPAAFAAPLRAFAPVLGAFAALVCMWAMACGSARAQQAVKPPVTSAARARPQPAPPRSSRPAAGARAGRSAPVYRVELIVFRAVSALGAPEDWAAEAGTSPVTSTDADPGGAEPGPTPASPAQTSPAQTSPAARSSTAQTSSTQTSASQTGAPQTAAPQATGTAPSGLVRILPASEFQLDGIAARLKGSGRYVPVAHIAWAQTASPWGKPMEIPVQSVGLDAQGITGTVALERGVFLHLALDLRYAMSDPPSGLDAPPGTVFVLDQSQRVRLKESSYFDHPAFGVIALVTSDQAPVRRAR